LYVSTVAGDTDPASRAKREAALTEADRLIAGMSNEARQLPAVRDVARLIAAARGPR
jgi:hypothetical protein